jgi:membrane-associated phospholipid phosphatase
VKKHRAMLLLVAGIGGFAVVLLLDRAIYHGLAPSIEGRHELEGRDWYWMLRIVGTFWTWLIVGVGLVCLDAMPRGARRRWPAWRRGLFVMLSAAAAGLGAELVKLIVARERPALIEEGVLTYQGPVFRGLFSGFAEGSNLGFPSSHVATAFGGAFALGMLMPPLMPLMLALAAGCGVTRLLTGAHFATDVYGGIVLGFVAAWGLGRVLGMRRLEGTS